MKTRLLFYCALWSVCVFGYLRSSAAGVTIITHGLNGNVDDWIIPMAEKIPTHPTFPGASFSCYTISFVTAGDGFRVTNKWIGGVAPEASDSGEILVKLDWRQLANNSYSTYEVAEMVVPQLLDANFMTDLKGHALVEWPLHLIGHSRGGSLVCEMSRLLGLQGVWVDQVTTLDPHPLNNDGFMDPIYTVVDATAVTYENVLFADNYWQDLDSFVYGKAVPGAYVRKLTSLGGGYNSIFGGSHSDVHLWYHGTLDLATPASDTGASIEAAQRRDWWTPFESRGTNAGYYYSRNGGGNRLSDAQPVVTRPQRIRDGMNQRWDFGAGENDNRVSLDFNSGAWPNLIDLNVTGDRELAIGTSMPIQYYFQYGPLTLTTATLQIFLDSDRNPLNTNSTPLAELTLQSTGADQVASGTADLPLSGSGISPGEYSIAGLVSDDTESRWLYAPGTITLIPGNTSPILSVAGWTTSGFSILIESPIGQTIIVESSENFETWTRRATNVMSESVWLYVDESAEEESNKRFYRAVAE